MSDRPARRGRPGHDQQAVIGAAVAAFDEHGYDATTMGTIAERLGVSKSALYHHISGKEELLALALEPAFLALDAGLRETEVSDAPVTERFEAFLRRIVGILVEYQPFVRILLRLRGNSPVEQDALARRREFDSRMATIVRTAQHEGALRTDLDPAILARLIFGAANSTVDWYRPDGRVPADDLAEAVVALALTGFAAPTSTVERA